MRTVDSPLITEGKVSMPPYLSCFFSRSQYKLRVRVSVSGPGLPHKNTAERSTQAIRRPKLPLLPVPSERLAHHDAVPPEVVMALGTPCRLADRLHGREGQVRERADDGDDHHDLDQSETAPLRRYGLATHCSPLDLKSLTKLVPIGGSDHSSVVRRANEFDPVAQQR